MESLRKFSYARQSKANFHPALSFELNEIIKNLSAN